MTDPYAPGGYYDGLPLNDTAELPMTEWTEEFRNSAGSGEHPAGRDSWEPVDLGPYLRGEIKQPEPSVGICRNDGIRLLYPGKEHSIVGEMEAGKTWFTTASAHAEITAGNHVVYVHFEEANPSDIIGRLLSLGTDEDNILALFHFVGPDIPVTADRMDRLCSYRPTLAILDGVNEAMSLHAMAIREEDGAAAFRRRLIKPFTAAGAAVLSCDHVIKDRESRGRYALGSIHKGNAIDGALLMLENAEPFGRGQRGRSHVYVTKDRPGFLRQHGRATGTPGKTLMAELVVDDEREWKDYLDLELFAVSAQPAESDSEGGNEHDEALCQSILDVLAAQPGQAVGSERKMLAALRLAEVKARSTVIRAALDDLEVQGRIEQFAGPRNALGYRVRTASQDQFKDAA
jgi:hypothetical protein